MDELIARLQAVVRGLGVCVLAHTMTLSPVHGMEQRHIVLVGASIGNGWKIQDLPRRLGSTEYSFEFIGEYEFDKSPAIARILARTDKPDAVILKECGTYFPGDLERQKRQVTAWIEELQRHGIVVIPATVAPVTWPRPLTAGYVKTVAKTILSLGRSPVEVRQRHLTAYNEWIRAYAKEHGLTVLDLEAALRRSDTDRRLRDELTSGDGLHLNRDAYALLDQIVIPTLRYVDWEPGGR